MHQGFVLTRRGVLRLAAAGTVSLAPGIGGAARMRFVVVGGGFGGAAAARAARDLAPTAEVVLYTDQDRYWMCPGSNGVVAGLYGLDRVAVSFDGLREIGVDVRVGSVTGIDAATRTVIDADGNRTVYDKLFLAPGIAFDYGDIEGLSEADIEQIPHAWKAGPQTALLAAQIQAMPDNGLFVMSMPRAPYRCPPAPAERACLVAHYLKTHKPGAKVLVLDAKDEFPFQDLFFEAWEMLYPGIVEYRSVADDGLIRAVDPNTKTVHTDFGEETADVLNVIPPQIAGPIAKACGAADASGWCPVEPGSFASTLLDHVYVIGDAALVDALPKAGSTAASQARLAVATAVAELTGKDLPPRTWIANCYSMAAPDYGIRLGASYALEDGHVVRTATDFSETGAPMQTRNEDAAFAEGWLDSVRREIWG